jgi:dienelactone hydrolase
MSMHAGVLATVAAWGPMKIGYNAAAAEDSWKRIAEFFGRHLGR